MSSKNIWNPGDIITTEKWNNINNISIRTSYRLPITITENTSLVINKSYTEIVELLKQGIICYYCLPQDETVTYFMYITAFYDKDHSLSDNQNTIFYEYTQNNTTFMSTDVLSRGIK